MKFTHTIKVIDEVVHMSSGAKSAKYGTFQESKKNLNDYLKKFIKKIPRGHWSSRQSHGAARGAAYIKHLEELRDGEA